MEAPEELPYHDDLYSLLGADDSTLGWPEVPKDEVEGDAKDKALGTPKPDQDLHDWPGLVDDCDDMPELAPHEDVKDDEDAEDMMGKTLSYVMHFLVFCF